MQLRTVLLAGLLGSTFLAGAAFGAENVWTLRTAAKEGNRTAVQTLLNSPVKPDVAGAEGTAALVWAASRNDIEMALDEADPRDVFREILVRVPPTGSNGSA